MKTKKSDRQGKGSPCPASKFQKMISGKYKLRILWSLKDSALRYGEIRKGLLTGEVGTPIVAPRVLGRELNSLIGTGMVERRDHRIFPLKWSMSSLQEVVVSFRYFQ